MKLSVVILLVVVGVLAVNGDGAGEYTGDDGDVYSDGDSFEDNCNRCSCNDGECTGDDGTVYSDGDSFEDDCNRCSCSDGMIACTKKACPSNGCEANGMTYQPGDSYIADDGCNNCFCTPRGVGACTRMAC